MYLGLCFLCACNDQVGPTLFIIEDTGIRGTQVTRTMTPPEEKAETLNPGPSGHPAPVLPPVSISVGSPYHCLCVHFFGLTAWRRKHIQEFGYQVLYSEQRTLDLCPHDDKCLQTKPCLGLCKVRVRCIPGPLTSPRLSSHSTPVPQTDSPGHILGTGLEESRSAILSDPRVPGQSCFQTPLSQEIG